MKLHFFKFLVLVGSMILFPASGGTQTSWIPIPISLEENPTGNDSFVPYYKPKRSKIALALSGGGARGLAQIGVLKVFERHGLPLDGIAGTSMGAVIGGLYALGYTATEIESLAHQIRWDEIIRDTPPRKQLFLGQKEEKAQYILQLRLKGFMLDIPSAYTSGQKLTSLLADLVMNSPYPFSADFDSLHIPFRSVTTDLITGEKIVLKKGSLVDALRASMAIPLLFTPVRLDSHMLLDGGLVQNLPVSEAKALGGDLIIAVDTSSKLRDPKSLNAPWEIADQVTTIMQQENTRSQLKLADIAIQPLFAGTSNTDFNHVGALIRAGEQAAEKALPQIEYFFNEDAISYADTSFKIKKISLSGCRNLDPASFLSKTFDTTSPVSTAQIVWTGQSLLQSGYFQKVSSFLDTSNYHLKFHVEENPFVENIKILGCQVFSDSSLRAMMETRPGEVLNIHKGRRDLQKLRDKYLRAGYALAQIDSTRIDEGILKIYINEGRINGIKLSGNDRTRPFVILREISLKAGDLLNVSALKQGIDNIYSTGYFEEVRFDLQKKGQSYDLILHLIEQGYTLLRLGLQYNLERRSQGFLQVVKENLLGFGGKGSLLGLMGKRDEIIQARLWSDRLFNTFLTYKLNFSTQKHRFDYYKNYKRVGSYKKSIQEGSFTIGQHMRRLGTISIQLRSEKINLQPSSGEATPHEKLTLRNISLRSEVDTRDRVPLPSKGKHHILEYETANRFLGSEVSYTKLFSSVESYYPLTPSFNFHPRICWGTSDLTTPFAKQFRLGGLDSFLGLPEEALVGKRFISLSGELRYLIPWPTWLEAYFSIRYDFGGIWERYSKITKEDFKHGIGVILSYNTPVGPIQIGYGHMSDGFNQFYFSAGYKF